MSCGFEEDLTAYLDRELSPLQVRQLEGHLPSCQECSSTLALLRQTLQALEALPAPAFTPSAQLRRDVLNRIAEQPPLLERLRALLLRPPVLVPALSAAAALAVALAVAQSGRGPLDEAGDPPLLVADASELELLQDLDMMEDFDVVGLESEEDLEVVEHLQELEGQP